MCHHQALVRYFYKDIFNISINVSFLDPAIMTYYKPINKKKKVRFIEEDTDEKMGPFSPLNSTK